MNLLKKIYPTMYCPKHNGNFLKSPEPLHIYLNKNCFGETLHDEIEKYGKTYLFVNIIHSPTKQYYFKLEANTYDNMIVNDSYKNSDPSYNIYIADNIIYETLLVSKKYPVKELLFYSFDRGNVYRLYNHTIS